MKHIRKPGYDFLQEARNSCGGGGVHYNAHCLESVGCKWAEWGGGGGGDSRRSRRDFLQRVLYAGVGVGGRWSTIRYTPELLVSSQ